MQKKREVGIKELKNKATQIVRDVREKNVQYVITLDGEAVAVLVPHKQIFEEERKAQQLATLKSMQEIARDISEAWDGDFTAAQAVKEQRR